MKQATEAEVVVVVVVVFNARGRPVKQASQRPPEGYRVC
jgi:hypothetical protein